ncbi:O-acyltransferase like protein-like isoform X2 [Belonocnema kinseyi]|uniref:O-acyltransferase like protein-like isoform X2 n=1 Tax=Belonocnema kinseyi TaxID=2817044 RepID=UPI00143D697C|nr:O-acyltransferase like protein-like isoform X2 [Belonocnema kinseyi]
MIPRLFSIYVLGIIINIIVFPIVKGKQIHFSENNLLLEENKYHTDSFNNIGTGTNFKTSENGEENEILENSYWFSNIPLLPVVVATSNSIPEGPCKKQLNLYLNHLKNGTLWATEMFDSSAKYPYGIFDGHLRHLGNFDQCFRIQTEIPNHERDGEFEEIRSRYCLVDIKYQEKNEATNFTGKLDIWFDPQGSAWEAIREKGDYRRYQRYLLQMALCVPAGCHPEDIVTALREPLENFNKLYNVQVQASVQKDLCQAAHEAKPISNYAITYCIVFISIIALVIVSTIYDSKSKEEEKQTLPTKLLFCFSARRSFNSIFKVNYQHRGFDCLHLLRIIGTYFVLFGHRNIQSLHTSTVIGRHLESLIVAPTTSFIFNGTIIVDGFLGIGGMMLSYQLLEFLERSKQLNVVLLIMNRLMRLVPLYAFVVFAYAVLLHHIGSGPFWENRFGFDRDSCSNYWWANLLFISNYTNSDNTCIFQSWYLSVDFQSFIVGLLLVGTFWKLPRKIGYVFLGSSVVFCTLIPFYVTYKQDIDPLFIGLGTRRRIEDYSYFTNYYIKTHMRLSAYVVGIMMGAFIYDYKFATWRLPKTVSRVLLVLQVVVLNFYCLHLGVQFFDPNEKPTLLKKALYASLHRPIYAFSVCSVALLVTVGDGLDFFYKMMTPGWAQPISKLSYGIFLLHFVIQSYDVGTARAASSNAIYGVIQYSISDFIFSFILSLFFVVMIEEPFKNLGNLLLMRKNPSGSDIKSSETPKKVD